MATRTIAIGVALLALALQGCRTSPRIDDHFGEAVRANLAAQAVNPAAAANTNPAAGIDGHAARAAQQRYEKSFEQAEQASTPSIVGIGSGQ
jgi:type IV pilus biogenesis protein CpaD/CtpE